MFEVHWYCLKSFIYVIIMSLPFRLQLLLGRASKISQTHINFFVDLKPSNWCWYWLLDKLQNSLIIFIISWPFNCTVVQIHIVINFLWAVTKKYLPVIGYRSWIYFLNRVIASYSSFVYLVLYVCDNSFHFSVENFSTL